MTTPEPFGGRANGKTKFQAQRGPTFEMACLAAIIIASEAIDL